MEVVSTCPLRVSYVVWRPRPDAWTLTVVCKATYLLLPDESPLAPEQDEPIEADSHWNDDESRSLHAATDMVPFKKRPEVLLVGHAYAPFGRPVGSLRTRLVVGDVDKTIEVVADRTWTMDGQLVEGAPFAKMPLRWERAAGGPGTGNPVGARADARPDSRGRVALPNLQPPGTYPTRPGEIIPPVGYGPIAPTWPERLTARQHVAVGWDHRVWEQQPLPERLDPAFFNAALRDQQLDVLRASERIVLENLHPEHPRLATNLAGVSPVAEVASGDPSTKRSALRCDTMVIDTDRGHCTLTWRAQIPIAHPADAVRVVISFAQPRRSGAPAGATVSGDYPGSPTATALPFAKNLPAAVDRAPVPAPLGPGGTVNLDVKDAMPPLPFRVGRSPLAGTMLGGAPPPPPAPPPTPPLPKVGFFDPDDDTTTQGFDRVGGSADHGETGTLPLSDVVDDPTTTQGMPPEGAWTPKAPALPFSPPPVPVPVFAPPPLPISVPAPLPISIPAPVAAPLPSTLPAPVPAPLEAPVPEPAPAPVPAVAPAPAAPAAALRVLQRSGPPLDRFPIERCAAIVASITRRRKDERAILEENDVVAADFRAVERHWAAALSAEAQRGRRALLDRYDDAYVARLEEERGPIAPMEYARLTVAGERGTAATVLAALSLPRDSAMRIERVWLRRMIADIALSRQVRTAISAAREE